MTCKLLILARRKDGVTHEECVRYLEETHVEKAKELPGLRKYRTAVPEDPDEAGFDEVSTLWFDDPDAVDEALRSEAGEAVLADAENFVDTERIEMITITDETTHLDARYRGRT